MNLQMHQESSLHKAYIVFQDSVSLPYLKLLKKGFRHCYILFQIDNNIWLELNPMSNQIHILLREFPEYYDYISHLNRQENVTVLSLLVQEAKLVPAPLGFFTCVEFAKRVLGVHNFLIITPYQLFKKLSTTY